MVCEGDDSRAPIVCVCVRVLACLPALRCLPLVCVWGIGRSPIALSVVALFFLPFILHTQLSSSTLCGNERSAAQLLSFADWFLGFLKSAERASTYYVYEGCLLLHCLLYLNFDIESLYINIKIYIFCIVAFRFI